MDLTTRPTHDPKLQEMLDLPGWPHARLLTIHTEEGPSNAGKRRLVETIARDGHMRIMGNPDWRTLFESFKDPPEILVLDDWRPDPVQSAAVLPHLLPILEKHTPKTALLAFMPPKVEKVFKFYAYARWTLTGEIAPFQLRCLKNALAPTQGHILAWP